MLQNDVVSRDDWLEARKALLVREKDLTPKGLNETGPHYNLMDWVKQHDQSGMQPAAAAAWE